MENGWRVLFTRTSDLVQRLQVARRKLALESALATSARSLGACGEAANYFKHAGYA
jgi:DNA replication protein DnaC